MKIITSLGRQIFFAVLLYWGKERKVILYFKKNLTPSKLKKVNCYENNNVHNKFHYSAICFLIFSNNKITKRTCFLDVGHVLLVSDFNQNRFDRFIFQGDILGSRLASATVKTHSTNVYLIYHSSNLHISEAATANRSQYSDMIFLEMRPSIVKPKS